jgi:hypothetical protein
MADIKALVKTTKSPFDIQVDIADKALKHNKGVNFAIVKGNKVEYIHVPNAPEQTFKYFYNPSKLTAEDRKKTIEQRIIAQKILHPEKSVVSIVEDLEP